MRFEQVPSCSATAEDLAHEEAMILVEGVFEWQGVGWTEASGRANR